MQIPKFDARALALRNDEKLAHELALQLEEVFSNHLTRTGNQQLALQEARRTAAKGFGFSCSVDETGATFAKRQCTFGVRMKQNEYGVIVFSVIDLYKS